MRQLVSNFDGWKSTMLLLIAIKFDLGQGVDKSFNEIGCISLKQNFNTPFYKTFVTVIFFLS